jgi:antitoxin component of MazEF toxin-antitoxin module
MARIASAHATKADKIRALNAAGYSRAGISRFLGVRYQHVRNVLEDGPPKGSPFARPQQVASGFEEAGAEPFAIDSSITLLRIPITDSGALQLPPAAMQALGLKPGGVVIAELDQDRLTLFSVRESVRRVQAMVRDLVPGDHSLADALIADRRREVSREDG